MQPLTPRDEKRGEGIMAHPGSPAARLARPIQPGSTRTSSASSRPPTRAAARAQPGQAFQNLSHFVEEAIVARDWLE